MGLIILKLLLTANGFYNNAIKEQFVQGSSEPK